MFHIKIQKFQIDKSRFQMRLCLCSTLLIERVPFFTYKCWFTAAVDVFVYGACSVGAL